MRARLASPGPSEINNDTLISKWVGWVKIKLAGKSLQLEARALGEATPRDQLSYTKP